MAKIITDTSHVVGACQPFSNTCANQDHDPKTRLAKIIEPLFPPTHNIDCHCIFSHQSNFPSSACLIGKA